MDQFPPSPDPNRGPRDWETQGVRRIGLLSSTGQNVEVKWANGPVGQDSRHRAGRAGRERDDYAAALIGS